MIGLNVSVAGDGQAIWKLALPAGETVKDIVSTRSGPVASFARVLGDRTSLYKCKSFLLLRLDGEDVRA